MRFAIVLDHFRRERGGMEHYLAELAARLAARGHEIRIYCVDGAAPSREVRLVRVEVHGFSRGAREADFAARAVALARSDGCDRVLGVRHVIDVDVYQPHGGTWAAATAARLALEGRPWRRTLRRVAHRWSSKQRYFVRADRAVFLRPGVLTLAVSPMVQADILKRYGDLGPRVEVLWPAIDTGRFHPGRRAAARAALHRRLAVPAAAPLMAFVAHDFALKGLAHALAALARSDSLRHGARLVIAGRGDAAPFRQLAQRLGLRSSVDFVGLLPDPVELLAGSDLLLHPTHYDPCALVTLEALACGVPVVTTARNGAAALLAEGGGRVVEEPQDEPALAAAIDGLLAAGELEQSAAARVGQARGWPAHLLEFERLIASAGGAR